MTVRTLFFCFAAIACSATHSQNLLQNPGFENGSMQWVAWAGAQLAATDSEVYSGSFAAAVTNRTEVWQGPVQSITGAMVDGGTYRISAWVRVSGTQEQPAGMTIAREDDAGLQFRSLIQSIAFPDRWVQLSEIYQHKIEGTQTRLDFYVQGPEPGITLFVDDVVIEEITENWRSVADAMIQNNRTVPVTITETAASGDLANATVTIKQQQRDFPIGTAIRHSAFSAHVNYRDYIIERFNWGVHENAAKWYANEAVQDQVTYADADEVLDWADSVGITMRGHTLFWAKEDQKPAWVLGLDDAALLVEVEDRMNQTATHFFDRFAHWDVNNEMMHWDFFAQRLGPQIISWMFSQARMHDPGVTLFVNDFNVVSGTETDRYVIHINDLLDQGIEVEAIGTQGHFDAVDPWAIWNRLDKLAALGLPIWITEMDVVRADPVERADALEGALTAAYAHPAVEGIMLWGFWAGAHWKGPDAALVDMDWTINPAGQRFDALLEQWSGNQSMTLDANGTTSLRLAPGTYEAVVNPEAGSPFAQSFTVSGGALSVEVILNIEVIFANSFE